MLLRKEKEKKSLLEVIYGGHPKVLYNVKIVMHHKGHIWYLQYANTCLYFGSILEKD